MNEKILTGAGLVKMPCTSSDSPMGKIRLYFFSDQTPEAIAKVQTIFQLEINGECYEGLISQMFQDIQVKPYLFQANMVFSLISKEEAIQLQKSSSFSMQIKQKLLQDAMNMGITHHKVGEYYKAIQYYTKHLRIALAFKDQVEEGMAYGNLGNIYQKIGEYYKGIEYYKKDLKIAQELQDQVIKKIVFGNLGNAYQNLEKYPKAIKYYKKGLMVALELADQEGVGMASYNLGNMYCSLEEYDQAINYYQQCLIVVLKLKNQEKEGAVYINLGGAHFYLGKYSEAINYYEIGLTIALKLQDLVRAGKIYGSLGNAYHELGEYDTAIKHHNQNLEIALKTKDLVEEGRAYGNLGNAYHELGEYGKAIENHNKNLNIAIKAKDLFEEGKIYGNLGNAYQGLGKYDQAIEYHEKNLEIVLGIKNLAEEGRAYGNLGSAYHGLGKYDKAIESHKKSLNIALKRKDKVSERKAYGNLGNAYRWLGELHQAIEYHNKDLNISLELKSQVGQEEAYGNLGIVYHCLGEYLRSVECHEKALKIALHLKNQVRAGKAYINLGIAYHGLKNYPRAIQSYKDALKIATELKDQVGEGRAYGNLGNAYFALGENHQSIQYHIKDLEIVLGLKDQVGIGGAYNNLGSIYYKLKQYPQSIEFYINYLNIALERKDLLGQASAYNNLGNIYQELEKFSQAEDYFFKSIEVATTLQRNAKQIQWQITLFEEWARPYIALEKMLILQNKTSKALEISDTRRSRALSSLLSQKLNLKNHQDFSSRSFEEMQQLAKKLATTFIVYSVASLNEKKPSIQAWVISSKGNSPPSICIPIQDQAYLQLDQIFKTFPYQTEVKRPKRNEKQPNQIFREKLSSWYDLLIAPLEQYLPSQDLGETLTFIPDGFLAHLPFGAFYNRQKDQYLIENYSISVAPSIQVLSLLDQLPKEASNQALLMGNPTTLQQEYNNLKKSEDEVRDIIAPLVQPFTVQVLTQKEATVGNIFTHALHSKIIHIAAHGVANQKPLDDPHSVFEGFFRLAPDEKYPTGDLHAKDINLLAVQKDESLLTLKADLVFMSACHLGRGNLKREGSIGPIWSFLGAGAKSTIASYWPLPEGDMTVKMVDTFYRHYLGIDTPKLGKARALQQAILMAMKTERDNPRQWGAFFLAGLMD